MSDNPLWHAEEVEEDDEPSEEEKQARVEMAAQKEAEW